MLLVGDIGGTKTELAIVDPAGGLRAIIAEGRFPSGSYPSLEAIISEFLAANPHPIGTACFDVAGPVVNGQAEITNLPWVISEANLCAKFGLRTARLLNDLEAMAYAVPMLGPDDLVTLSAGQPVTHGAIAVIAPGTGLGEAFLVWDGSNYRACPSEGGHTDFAPTTPLQDGLLSFLRGRFGRVSYERVCSGIGIPNIYDYLRTIDHASEDPATSATIAAATDRTKAIFAAALAEHHASPLCQATIDLFIEILGAEAGNLALKVLAVGGIYIGGGIPPRILPQIQRGALLAKLREKGRFADTVSTMPVHIITNPRPALLGAAAFGLTL